MAKASLWSISQAETFITVLESTGNVSRAAREAKVSRFSAYEKRKSDTTFKQAWDAAMEGALDDLEEELRRRALTGTEKPIYYAGKQVGDVKNYNDTLAMFLLKARRKNIFGEAVGNDSPGQTSDTQSVREKLLSKLEQIKEANGK